MTLLKSLPSLSIFISNPNRVLALCPHGLILSKTCTKIDYHCPRFFFFPLSLPHSYIPLIIEGTGLRRTLEFKIQPEKAETEEIVSGLESLMVLLFPEWGL